MAGGVATKDGKNDFFSNRKFKPNYAVEEDEEKSKTTDQEGSKIPDTLDLYQRRHQEKELKKQKWKKDLEDQMEEQRRRKEEERRRFKEEDEYQEAKAAVERRVIEDRYKQEKSREERIVTVANQAQDELFNPKERELREEIFKKDPIDLEKELNFERILEHRREQRAKKNARHMKRLEYQIRGKDVTPSLDSDEDSADEIVKEEVLDTWSRIHANKPNMPENLIPFDHFLTREENFKKRDFYFFLEHSKRDKLKGEKPFATRYINPDRMVRLSPAEEKDQIIKALKRGTGGIKLRSLMSDKEKAVNYLSKEQMERSSKMSKMRRSMQKQAKRVELSKKFHEQEKDRLDQAEKWNHLNDKVNAQFNLDAGFKKPKIVIPSIDFDRVKQDFLRNLTSLETFKVNSMSMNDVKLLQGHDYMQEERKPKISKLYASASQIERKELESNAEIMVLMEKMGQMLHNN